MTHGDAPVRGTSDQWAEFLARPANEQPFTRFVFRPEGDVLNQTIRFAGEVVPATETRLIGGPTRR